MEQQYQMISSQLQSIANEVNEIEVTLAELKDVSDTLVYKSVGSVLFKKDKDTVEKELTERKETLELRKTTLERQESRLREKIQSAQKKIQEMLGQGISASPKGN